MTSLVRERMLIFSPALAATIGLEEAILLHLLHEVGSCRPGRAQGWFEVELQTLAQLLPFWERAQLQRVCASLVDKGVLQARWETDPLQFSFNERDCAPAPRERRRNPSAAAADAPRAPLRPRGATLLGRDWRPDEDLLQMLELNSGIPREFALEQLEDFIFYWTDRAEVSHAWASRFRSHVLHSWRRREQRVGEERRPLDNGPEADWHPSPDALQILERSGVNREFIEDAIPEFILFWRERGASDGTWNSKFIAHIRRQWAHYRNALQHEQEPRPIAANWQPSEDVYDILRMANIDLAFARELIPEFILFWRDTGSVQRSWNTKFLQHVKYQWATRHHLQHGGGHARAQLTAGASPQPASSTFEQLTDRSWASGLIDGI